MMGLLRRGGIREMVVSVASCLFVVLLARMAFDGDG